MDRSFERLIIMLTSNVFIHSLRCTVKNIFSEGDSFDIQLPPSDPPTSSFLPLNFCKSCLMCYATKFLFCDLAKILLKTRHEKPIVNINAIPGS